MNNHLRNYFRSQREQKGIRLGKLAERVGYKNRSKGAQRILTFEREGEIDDDFLERLCGALELDPEGVREAMAKDRQEWEEWVNEPTEIKIIIRIMATDYSPKAIPQGISTPAAVAYAQPFAKERRLNVCLVLSRKESVWIGSDGEITRKTFAEPGLPNIPYSTLGGRRKFLLNTERGAFSPAVVKES